MNQLEFKSFGQPPDLLIEDCQQYGNIWGTGSRWGFFKNYYSMNEWLPELYEE